MTALDEALSFTPAEHIFRSEMATAGAAMSSAKAAEVLGDIVRPEHFRSPANGVIFAAALALAERGTAVDPNAVLAEITRAGDLRAAGGANHVHDCLAANSTAADPARDAREVRQDWDRRNLGEVLSRSLQYVHGETYDPAEGLDRVRGWVEAATAPAHMDGIQSTEDLLLEVVDSLEREEQRGLATPLVNLNHLINGFCPGEMVVLAARPGIGKSLTALGAVAKAAIGEGVPAVLFSMEMSRREIMTRLISSVGKVPLWSLLHRQLSDDDWDRIAKAQQRIADAADLLVIDDTRNCTLAHIKARLRGMARTNPAGLAVVDYMQLLTGDGKAENRQTEVAAFSRGLKLIAGEFGIPVLALSQLNRSPEHRKDKRPQLSDLRESGAQEQDADIVILLHREDAYERESARMGEIDFIVAKNRNGPQNVTVTAAFQGEYARIVDLAQYPESSAA